MEVVSVGKIFASILKPFRRRRHALAVGLLAFAQVAMASSSVAQGRPISATLVQDMEFGAVVATSSSGSVILYPSTQNPLYNGVISAGGAVFPAEFDIRGEKLQPFTIILPSAPVLIPGPSGSIVIDNFVSIPAEGANGTFDAQGRATVTVGATMYVTDQLSAGPYSSSFDLVVSY